MRWFKNILLTLITVLVCITPVFAETDYLYFGFPLINPETKRIDYEVVQIEKNQFGLGNNGSKFKKIYNDFEGIDYNSEDGYSELLWPDVEKGTIIAGDESDYNQSDAVMSEVVDNLNTLIEFYDAWGVDLDTSDLTSLSSLLNTVASRFGKQGASNSDEAYPSGTLGNNVKVTSYDVFIAAYESTQPKITSNLRKQVENIITKSNKGRLKGTSTSDFCVVYSDYTGAQSSGETWYTLIRWRVPKGYSNEQSLGAYNETRGTAGNTYVTIGEVAHYANSALSNTQTTTLAGGFSSLKIKSSLESDLNLVFGTLPSMIAKALSFDDVNTLIFNLNSNYYLGLMPNSWWNVSSNLYWFAEIIAVIVLLFSIVSMAFKQSAATISPIVRNSIKDSIMNTIIAIVLIIAYPLLFYILAKINAMLVDTFSTFAKTSLSLQSSNVGGFAGQLVGLLFTFINLGLLLKMNIDYLTRSIMIAILNIIAPAMIATISFGGAYRGSRLFSNWCKELISAIFMQGFDALVLSIFLMVISSGFSTKWWWNQVFVYIICALNSWFKQSLLGLSGSVNSVAKEGHQMGDKVANATQGVATGIAMVATGAAMAGAGALMGASGAAAGGMTGAESTAAQNTISTKTSGGSGPSSNITSNIKTGNLSSESPVRTKPNNTKLDEIKPGVFVPTDKTNTSEDEASSSQIPDAKPERSNESSGNDNKSNTNTSTGKTYKPRNEWVSKGAGMAARGLKVAGGSILQQGELSGEGWGSVLRREGMRQPEGTKKAQGNMSSNNDDFKPEGGKKDTDYKRETTLDKDKYNDDINKDIYAKIEEAKKKKEAAENDLDVTEDTLPPEGEDGE